MTLNRREFLGAAAVAAAAFRVAMSAEQALVPAGQALDHLIVGVADLDAGIAWFEQRTGVRAVIGGSHPGRGTRNALLSLGGRQYLELLSVDPVQDPSLRPALRALKEPRVIGWAAAATNIADVAARVKAGGLTAVGPRPGSRTRPDGSQIKWTTLAVQHTLARDPDDPIPFFIEWDAASRHPSQDSPGGCSLATFEFEHPDAEPLRDMLRRIGLEAAVRPAKQIRLRASLQTGRGRLEL
jgi:hypothetical protein